MKSNLQKSEIKLTFPIDKFSRVFTLVVGLYTQTFFFDTFWVL